MTATRFAQLQVGSHSDTWRAVAYRCTVADELFDRALSLPSSVDLGEADQERVISALIEHA